MANRTEIMYDAVNVSKLPANASVYAAYVNGDFTNHSAVQARFPHARVFGIDVIGDAWIAASILDWEEGNPCYTTTFLRRFVAEREAFRPGTACIYCDRADLAKAEYVLKGLWHVNWITTLDGTILTGQKTSSGSLIVATQYAGGLTADYDTSEILSSWAK